MSFETDLYRLSESCVGAGQVAQACVLRFLAHLFFFILLLGDAGCAAVDLAAVGVVVEA